MNQQGVAKISESVNDHSKNYCRNYSRNLISYVVYRVYTPDFLSQLSNKVAVCRPFLVVFVYHLTSFVQCNQNIILYVIIIKLKCNIIK